MGETHGHEKIVVYFFLDGDPTGGDGGLSPDDPVRVKTSICPLAYSMGFAHGYSWGLPLQGKPSFDFIRHFSDSPCYQAQDFQIEVTDSDSMWKRGGPRLVTDIGS
jgi:hypothetical protein